MYEVEGKNRILVVGSEPDFLEMTRKALEASFELAYAPNENEGLEKARRERPDAIILGYLEPQGTSFELHKKLQGGWITKHIPLLVVDVHIDGQSRRVLTRAEGLQMEADDYISISGDDYVSLSHLVESVGLREKLNTKLRERVNTLREAILDPDTFCITWEQIPGRGAFEIQQEEIIENVEKAAKGEAIHAISVTDNPGGNPALSTEMLCAEIKKLEIEPLVHLACRDKNRNEIESMLYGLAAAGVRNLLVLTGDYPSNDAFKGRPKPVFDLDPVHVLQLAEMMNKGLEHEVMRRKRTLAPTDFFAGVCVAPFKQLEAELMGQYNKLRKKIEGGAKFIITQVGYDARKFHELLLWLRINGYDIPVLVNIYIMPYGTARLMNDNQIPGCVVTDKLLAEVAEEAKAEDKGRSARLTRAAKMYAIAKGMGFAGAHIGGHGITYEAVEYVIEKGEELSKDWESLVAEFDYPQRNGFYFFEKDTKTGLNLDKPAARPSKFSLQLMYRFCRVAHALLFEPKSPSFKMLKPFARLMDSSPTSKKTFGYFEHLLKVALFGCMNCGDCALFDVAYLCPMSRCPKDQRNGPCGGSYGGWCEVYPNERKCIWVRAYERLKAFNEEDEIGAYVTPPCNWELWETPSWLNFYFGRDHTAIRLGIETQQDGASLEKSSIATSEIPSSG